MIAGSWTACGDSVNTGMAGGTAVAGCAENGYPIISGRYMVSNVASPEGNIEDAMENEQPPQTLTRHGI